MSLANFPTSLDVIPDPSASTGTADAGFYHDQLHSWANDAIYAAQTKIGVDNSPLTSSLDYLMHHHTHLGTDGSAALSTLTAQAVGTDGTLENLMAVSGQSIFKVSSASAGPTTLVQAPTATTVGEVVKAPTGVTTADLTQWQSSAATALAGVTASGGLYTSSTFSLTKGVAGNPYLSTVPASGEVDLVNGGYLRGYSGAYGTGQQFELNGSSGFLKLGATSGVPSLVLNNWQTTRTSEMQLWGKDNADAGLTSFGVLADADGQVLAARSLVVRGNLGETTGGTLIGTDNFLALSYPTYDGNTTYTKAAGISVLPATAPPLTAGNFGVAGNLSTTGNATIGGSLSVTGSLTSGGLTLTTLTTSGNGTIGGTLHVTGATTLAGLTATTLSVTGTSTMGAVTGTTLGANASGTTGRYIGALTAPPTSGTWNAGDFYNDPTHGVFGICLTGGTPGTWTQIGGKPNWTALPVNAGYNGTPVSGYSAAYYYLDNAGFVNFRGVIWTTQAALAAGASSGVIATLPVGFRPGYQEPFAILMNAGSTQGGPGRMDITANGNITVSNTSGVASAANWWAMVNGIRFAQVN